MSKKGGFSISIDGENIADVSGEAMADFYLAHSPNKQAGHRKRSDLQRDKRRRDGPAPQA